MAVRSATFHFLIHAGSVQFRVVVDVLPSLENTDQILTLNPLTCLDVYDLRLSDLNLLTLLTFRSLPLDLTEVIALMAVHGAAVGERPSAHAALERALVGVRAQVLKQLRGMGETALADPAGVGSLASVQALVLVEGATVHEVLAAVIAAEGPLLGVCVHVLVDVGLLRESLVAQRALEWFLPCKHTTSVRNLTGERRRKMKTEGETL